MVDFTGYLSRQAPESARLLIFIFFEPDQTGLRLMYTDLYEIFGFPFFLPFKLQIRFVSHVIKKLKKLKMN